MSVKLNSFIYCNNSFRVWAWEVSIPVDLSISGWRVQLKSPPIMKLPDKSARDKNRFLKKDGLSSLGQYKFTRFNLIESISHWIIMYLPYRSSSTLMRWKGRELCIRMITPRERELDEAEKTRPGHLLLTFTTSSGVKCVSCRKTILAFSCLILLITCLSLTSLFRPLTFQEVNWSSNDMI